MASIYSNPTIRACGSFNPDRIAAKLHKALKGLGTDERIIIDVLTSHTNSQRQVIKSKYRTMYGRELLDDLSKELGGLFEDTCLALFTLPTEYLTQWISIAVKTGNVAAIADILLGFTSYELEDVEKLFMKTQGVDMKSFISELFDDDIRKALETLVACRCTTSQLNSGAEDPRDQAENDAKLLFEGQKRLNDVQANYDPYIMVLCGRKPVQLEAIIESYERLSGHSIYVAIEKNFYGTLQELLTGIVEAAISLPDYFARRLHDVINSVRIDDRTLIRILITRSELDLEDIKEAYRRRFAKRLPDEVARETSGDYRKLLLKLLCP